MPPRNTGNGDPGNVFYIRSTDKRRDFQRAVQVEHRHRNHQGAVAAQPSVSEAGTLFATWYDERESSGQLPAVKPRYSLLPDVVAQI